MSHQFKPGDLALTLIEGIVFPLMTQVEIIERVNPKGWWAVGRSGRQSVYHQKNLMPLRGDFEPEQQKAREVELCA